jgi:hypothetical protein
MAREGHAQTGQEIFGLRGVDAPAARSAMCPP